MGLTIDQLYEAYMDIDEAGEPTIATDFARDVFEWFKPEEYVGMTPGQWAQEYGIYIAPFDPTATLSKIECMILQLKTPGISLKKK